MQKERENLKELLRKKEPEFEVLENLSLSILQKKKKKNENVSSEKNTKSG